MAQRKTIAVLGLGTFGQALCTSLANAEAEVIAIDSSPAIVDALTHVATRTMVGDTTDVQVLEEAGVRGCDEVIIAIGEDTESSIITVFNVLDLDIPVDHIYARAVTRTHRRILAKLGMDEEHIINPEETAAERYAAAVSPSGSELLASFDDDVQFVVVHVPERFDDKNLQELDLRRRFGINVVGVRSVRREVGEDGNDVAVPSFILPDGTTRVHASDRLVVVGRSGDISRFIAEHS